jgi:NAD kinase
VTLTTRAVLVHRRTELDELLWRHGTLGQAAFFLKSRGRAVEEVEERHAAVTAAIAAVSAAIPADWRRGTVERADLPRFGFDPEDIVIAVGQDGLVANLAKYLDGQLVVGINPEPDRNPGVLVPHPPSSAARLLRATGRPAELASVTELTPVTELTMVQADTDDGQRLTALNELYIGQPTHQTARYALALPDGAAEDQASSGLIVSTGTGATGWCRSAWLERRSSLTLPSPAERRLAWFVREAWPSPATGTTRTEGELAAGQALTLSVESDRLVIFGDGIEADAIELSWGQSARIALSTKTLRILS